MVKLARSVVPRIAAQSPVLFFQNPGYLGDKVAAGAVCDDLAGDGASVLGFEWTTDQISLLELGDKTDAAFQLASRYADPDEPALELIEILLQRATSGERALAVETIHTQQALSGSMRHRLRAACRTESLWRLAEQAAQNGCYPRLLPTSHHVAIATTILRRHGIAPGGYVVLHTRDAKRDGGRNTPLLGKLGLCERLIDDLGLAVVWIGDRGAENASLPTTDRFVDLSREHLEIPTLAALQRGAVAHVGPDSGPGHVAAAAGSMVISIERDDTSPNTGFGPYAPVGNVVLLPRGASDDLIIEALGALPRSRRFTEVRTARDATPNSDWPSQPLAKPLGFYSSLSDGRASDWVVGMYEDLLGEVGLPAHYLPLRSRAMDAGVDWLSHLGASGFTISTPFKRDVMRRATSLDDHCRAIGASNTFVRAGDGWRAYNTDWLGVADVLKDGIREASPTAIVLGAGGAARAAIYALQQIGASVSVSARDPSRARAVALAFGARTHAWTDAVTKPPHVIVNATSADPNELVTQEIVGTMPFGSGCTYLDMHVDLHPTPTMRLAAEAGADVVSGFDMLRAQAIHQARLFGASRS